MAKILGYVLDNGVLLGPKAFVMECPDPDEIMPAPIYTVLLKHPEGYVLFDAACHDNKERQAPFIFDALHLKEEERLLNRLAGIGVSPDEIRFLVLSHMHADHTGFLDKFPNAEILVSDREFTNSVKEYALGTSRSCPDFEYWISLKLNWKLLPDDEKKIELLDGITILNFGCGHSHGMMGLLVDFEKTGKVMIVSDAIYMREHLEPPRPVPLVVQDRDGYLGTLDYIDALAKEENAAIWFGHDIGQNKELIKSTDGFYE